MRDNKDILSSLDFEKHIKELTDRGLIEFVARQQYGMSQLCPVHDRRLHRLENRSKKAIGATGGLSALFGAAVATVLDYFMKR